MTVEERRGGDDADGARLGFRAGHAQRCRAHGLPLPVRSAPARLATRARYFSIWSRRPASSPIRASSSREAPGEHLVETVEHGGGRAADGVDVVQLADLGERQAEQLEALDEAQPLDLVGAVDATAAGAAAHARQQPEFLVVADGAGRQAGLLADLADRELRGLGTRAIRRVCQLTSTG